MKKTIKSIAAVMVVLTLCLGLIAGCAANPLVGKYTPSKVSVAGIEVDLKGDMSALGDAADQVKALVDGMYIELKGDGTVVAAFSGDVQEGKWEEKNGTIVVDGYDLCKVQDGNLVVEAGGTTMVLSK